MEALIGFAIGYYVGTRDGREGLQQTGGMGFAQGVVGVVADKAGKIMSGGLRAA